MITSFFFFDWDSCLLLQAQIWIIKTLGYNSTIQYFQYNSQTFLWSRWDRVSFLAFGNSRVAFSSLSLCTVKLSFVAFGRNWLSSCYLGSQSPCLTHNDCFFPFISLIVLPWFHSPQQFQFVFPVRLIRTSCPSLLVLNCSRGPDGVSWLETLLF